MTDCDWLLALLSDGKTHTLNSILQRSLEERGCGITAHSRVAELRKRGHDIKNERIPGKVRGSASAYRLLSAPTGPIHEPAPQRTFVVPDCHGRHQHLRGLLLGAGIINERGERISGPGVTVVQLGDLANCILRDREGDLACLTAARRWFDVVLIGNHEFPHLGGPTFSGFWQVPEVAEAVKALRWRPCHLVGRTLLTHAGVAAGLSALLVDARQASDVIREAWAEPSAARHPLFASIGRARGGSGKVGGVLWSDANFEPRDDRFSQIYGHTPDCDGPVRKDAANGTFTLNLDCGVRSGAERLVGAWLDVLGDVVSFVEYRPSAWAAA